MHALDPPVLKFAIGYLPIFVSIKLFNNLSELLGGKLFAQFSSNITNLFKINAATFIQIKAIKYLLQVNLILDRIHKSDIINNVDLMSFIFNIIPLYTELINGY